MEVKKKKFIFISTAIVVLMASLIALLHFFGPGEKYLTKRGADWQKKVLEDGKAHAEIIRNSDLDWTIVRAPRLTLEKGKGKYSKYLPLRIHRTGSGNTFECFEL